MKWMILIFAIGFVSVGNCQMFLDYLVDTWVAHNMHMVNTTSSGEQTVRGIQFETNCNIMISTIKCNATSDLGIITNLTTLSRVSETDVTLSSRDPRTATITLSLAYSDLQIHYPNMIITGDGILVEYKDIVTKSSNPITITAIIEMEYSKNDNNCTNTINVRTPSLSDLTITTTVGHPKATLTLADQLTYQIMTALLDDINNHVSSLIAYHNPCKKLADLF